MTTINISDAERTRIRNYIAANESCLSSMYSDYLSVCAGGANLTYTMPNPPNATIQWSVELNNSYQTKLRIVSVSGNTVTFNAKAGTSGESDIIARWKEDANGWREFRKSVWVGVPSSPTLTFQTSTPVVCEHGSYLNISATSQGATGFDMEFKDNNNNLLQSYTNGVSGSFILVTTGEYPAGSYSVSFRGRNNCGVSDWKKTVFNIVSQSDSRCATVAQIAPNPEPVISFTAYPNPASSQLSVAYENESEVLTQLSKQDAKFEVELYNMMQVRVAQEKSNEGKAITLNVSSLPEGVYALRIYRGKEVEVKQVMIQR